MLNFLKYMRVLIFHLNLQHQLFTFHQFELVDLQTMSIYLCFTLVILFTSTLVQGHDNIDMDAANNILSSSSELENTLTQHNNPIRIGKL